MNKSFRTYVAAMLAFTLLLLVTRRLELAVGAAVAIAGIGIALRWLPRRA